MSTEESTIALVPDVVPTLEQLAETVRREHNLAAEAGQAMVGHVIAAGEALLAAKAQVEFGGWDRWLQANFPDKHPKTLRLYMRVAKHRDRVEDENPPTLEAAQRLLAGASIRPHEDELKVEARRLRSQEGLSYQAIADRLGVSHHAVNGWFNPRVAERRRRRRMQESREARRALHREQRDGAIRKAGGGIAEAYSLMRKTLQALDAAASEEGDADARTAIAAAQNRLYAAEDLIAKAVRTHRDRPELAA